MLVMVIFIPVDAAMWYLSRINRVRVRTSSPTAYGPKPIYTTVPLGPVPLESLFIEDKFFMIMGRESLGVIFMILNTAR